VVIGVLALGWPAVTVLVIAVLVGVRLVGAVAALVLSAGEVAAGVAIHRAARPGLLSPACCGAWCSRHPPRRSALSLNSIYFPGKITSSWGRC
jgi:hypothetical protein